MSERATAPYGARYRLHKLSSAFPEDKSRRQRAEFAVLTIPMGDAPRIRKIAFSNS